MEKCIELYEELPIQRWGQNNGNGKNGKRVPITILKEEMNSIKEKGSFQRMDDHRNQAQRAGTHCLARGKSTCKWSGKPLTS